jgi:hypothetical protein
MFKTVLTIAATLAGMGTAFAGSDHYGSDSANAKIDYSYTASLAKGQGVDDGISGASVTPLINQIQGVDQGITYAKKLNKIGSFEAHELHMRAAHISQTAQRSAAAGHGTISAEQQRQLLHQLDGVSQSLRADTGSVSLLGNGGDGGYYPNGYGPFD